MRVKFLKDYQGALTRERFFAAGQEAELGNGEALLLASRDVVELAEPQAPAAAKPAAPGKKARDG